ncbi:hypothetical protein [Telmatospirillum siberiense]|uniref:Uncharacterized protein n=1 Tax=Telmatospirillum siberiense TaxID=382514 RepID=A0A2N3PRE7_9PROT|nr:hypothetical protein [Telmatospirillum siberiense]PKU22971.1 hypothetical protein CWS72_19155 [Telmatospirillum siberiense]
MPSGIRQGASDLRVASDRVSLFKALGGGWDESGAAVTSAIGTEQTALVDFAVRNYSFYSSSFLIVQSPRNLNSRSD